MSVLTISNSISFRNISNVFGRTDPISLSEYLAMLILVIQAV